MKGTSALEAIELSLLLKRWMVHRLSCEVRTLTAALDVLNRGR